jgi:hypothetical protein
MEAWLKWLSASLESTESSEFKPQYFLKKLKTERKRKVNRKEVAEFKCPVSRFYLC